MATLQELLSQEAELFAQMQTLWKSLAGVRVRIAEMREINRNAVTYNLPSEILSAIFEAGESETPDASRRLSMSIYDERKPPRPFELLVSTVSRRWRTVALQTPRLWTNLNINISQQTTNLHVLYLRRSKICALNITFTQSNSRWVDANRGLDPSIRFKWYLELLIPHVARWRKLAIRNAFVGSISTAFSALTDLHAPVLETLVAKFTTDQGRQPVMEVFSRGAPRLSSMELGVYFRPPQGAPVKHLKLSLKLSHTEFTQILRPMSSLTHLSIDESMLMGTNPSSIELPSVISLDIQLCHRFAVDVGNFGCLDFPAVEMLTIHGYSQQVIKTLTGHRRLYPAVTLFTIVCENFVGARDVPDAMVLDFISLLPNVRQVTFQGANPIAIFQALHDRQPTDKLLWSHLSMITVTLPELGKLTVSYKKEIWAYIIKVVKNRLELGTPILCIILPLQIIERGSNKQQRWFKEQVALVEC
jgi:hypothetical protein